MFNAQRKNYPSAKGYFKVATRKKAGIRRKIEGGEEEIPGTRVLIKNVKSGYQGIRISVNRISVYQNTRMRIQKIRVSDRLGNIEKSDILVF